MAAFVQNSPFYDFKDGDTVRCVPAAIKNSDHEGRGAGWVENEVFVIKEISSGTGGNNIAWRKDGKGGVYFSALQLWKGGEKSMIANKYQLTELQKESLDADTQVLVEEGVLDMSLRLMDSTAFLEYLIRQNKKPFAAELKARRAEYEKEKKKA